TKVTTDYSKGTEQAAVDKVAGWIKNSQGVLIYDNYDLWQIDPAGIVKPTNITAGYGLKNHIKLRLINSNTYGNSLIFKNGDDFLLTGFNIDNKYNGYFLQH